MKKSIGIGLLLLIVFSITACQGPLTTTSTFQLSQLLKSRWLSQGADPQDITDTFSKIKSSNESLWTQEWVRLADRYAQKVNEHLEKKELDSVYDPAFKAALYYRIASFPALYSPEKKAAYDLAQKFYAESMKFAASAPQRLSISFEGKEIVGYFKKPGGQTRAPLIILIPGIESIKEDYLIDLDRFANAGLAIFVIDLPGTGESFWKYRPDSTQLIQAITQYFKNSPYINGNQIGVIGFNLGGTLAVKSAAIDAPIKAVAGINTPVSTAFQTAFINRLPRFFQKMFSHTTGFERFSELNKEIEEYSLTHNQLLQSFKKPLVLMAGSEDILASATDQLLVAEQVQQPVLMKTYPQGQFGLYDQLHSEIYPYLIDWFSEQFSL